MSQAGTASAMPASHARSWWPFAGAIGMAIIVGAALEGGYGIVIYRLRYSPAGQEALAQIHASAQLQQLLGEPLKVHIEGGDLAHDGEASFDLRVKGPTGSAELDVTSKREGKAWRVVSGTIKLPDERELPLDPAVVESARPGEPAKATPGEPGKPTQGDSAKPLEHGPQP